MVADVEPGENRQRPQRGCGMIVQIGKPTSGGVNPTLDVEWEHELESLNACMIVGKKALLGSPLDHDRVAVVLSSHSRNVVCWFEWRADVVVRCQVD